MTPRRLLRVGIVVLLVISAGCVTTEKEWARVRETSEARTGFSLDWEENEADAEPIKKRVNDLLADGLTEDEAVQVALLNNKMLQADFERIGIENSQFAQASLLSNPNLGLDVRFPTGGGFTTIEGGLIWNIADLWIIPVERKWRGYELEATLATVNNRVIETAAMAKRAYLELQIAVEMRAFVAKHVDCIASSRSKSHIVTNSDCTMTSIVIWRRLIGRRRRSNSRDSTPRSRRHGLD